ncbi:serine/Arginine-related protein 53 [Entelurus aequoreus]|uniref:serine/Arginine-related protein 53 n=1 Tax=Entelurus aequoreus TaxID=161455 RepID=UPI002B1E2F1C|nr:serine/Arginine-related protein 53 [Entelurus aequoreus]
MGRRSSSSEEGSRSRKKRKQRRRSSSSSSSSSSSGSRVTSSRSHRSNRRSRSRSRDRRRKRRSNSSSSHSSSRRRRSRSGDKGRSHRSHRSRSKDRRSHSRHRRSRSKSGSRRGSHGRRRSRSRSRDRSNRGRHKGRDKDKERDRGRNRDKEKSKDKAEKKGDTASMKARLEHLTPAEQAKVRMQMVLEAAAKTDEVLKAKIARQEEETRKKLDTDGTSLEEQVQRIKDIEAIESDSFVPQAFKSSRDDIKIELGVKQEPDLTDDVDMSFPTSIIYNETDTLAHPALFMDKEKAEELWLTRLRSLRQERLMGSPVS